MGGAVTPSPVTLLALAFSLCRRRAKYEEKQESHCRYRGRGGGQCDFLFSLYQRCHLSDIKPATMCQISRYGPVINNGDAAITMYVHAMIRQSDTCSCKQLFFFLATAHGSSRGFFFVEERRRLMDVANLDAIYDI